jgi:hypothetical protein
MVTSALTGSLVLSFICRPDEELEPEDGFILSQWLGLFTLAAILLVLSLIWPLKPLVTCTLTVGLWVAAFGRSRSRGIFLTSLVSLKASALLPLIGLAAVCALYVSQVIFWGDTGHYHFSLVRWLAEYGQVKGISHLNNFFGFGSSWFALTAVWNHGPLAGHSGALMGGYALLLMLVHGGLSLARCAGNQNERGSWFVVMGYAIIFPLLWRWGAAISPSPDIPVMLLGVLAGSILLNSVIDSKTAAWLLLVLAALAFNVKLSSLPLLIMAWLYAMFALSGRERIWATMITALCVLPSMAASTVNTGFPLYPSHLLMLDVPWRLETQVVRRVSKTVFDFATYGPEAWKLPGLQTQGFIAWLVHWSTSRLQWPAALLILSGISMLGHLIYHKKIYDVAVWKTALIAVVGILFFMLTAPTLRFGLAWLVILPALWVAVMRPAFLEAVIRRLTLTKYVGLICTSLLLSIWLSPNGMQKILYPALSAGEIDLEGNARINFVMPPPMPNMTLTWDDNQRVIGAGPPQVEIHQAAGFTYYTNRSGCWNVSLPCGDFENLVSIELLQPAKGIAGGFVRNKSAE